MERPQADTTPEIEVLDGQVSVEELLAELGFDWSVDPVDGARAAGTADGDSFTQPALF